MIWSSTRVILLCRLCFLFAYCYTDIYIIVPHTDILTFVVCITHYAGAIASTSPKPSGAT